MFHRLTAPTYYIAGGGPLPAGYDYLNDPVAGGTGTGIAAPADAGAKSGGTYDGTYFVGEDNEQANATNVNRPAFAVGTNTDAIDDILHRFTYEPATLVSNRTSAGEASLAVTSNHLYSDIFFTIITPNGGPLYVAGVRAAVSSATGATDTDGFYTTNITLNYNVTIPSGVVYSVLGASRGTFATLDSPSYAILWAPSIADEALAPFRYDNDIVTVSDGGVTSQGGDYGNADISSLTDATSDLNNIALRPGAYKVSGSAGWLQGGRVHATQPGTAKVSIDSARGTNVVMASAVGGIGLTDVSLGTDSTAGVHFRVTGDFDYRSIGTTTSVEAGSLELFGASIAFMHRISGMRIVANATLTTADSSLRITGSANLDVNGLVVTAVPTASTPTAYLLIDSYAGRATIRNSVIGSSASGIDGLRINGSSNTVTRITFEDCDILHNGVGDAWALKIIDSTGIVFRNCRFFSERGQCIRIENSSVTFEDCTIESGSDTGLSNAQLICGEGYISGADTGALKFIRCKAVYGAANVRATGVPIKPIIELGGRDAVVHAGPVAVDGLLVTPVSSALGVHNYTTVVLHSGAGGAKEPNRYDNVTIDMLACVPAASGTLAQFMGGFNGSGLVVELVGAADVPKLTARNLRILRVGWPATSIARSVVGALYADIDGLTIDGSTPGAGDYSGPLADLRLGHFNRVDFFPTAGLLSSAVSGAALEGSVTCQVTKLRYHHRTSGAVLGGPLIQISDGYLEDALVLIDQNITSANPLFRLSSDRSAFRNCFFFLNGTCAGEMLKADGIAGAEVMDCTFIWAHTGATQIADLNTFTDGRCIGNQFASTTAFLPTVDYANATGIPATADFATLNMILSAVLSSPPTVY